MSDVIIAIVPAPGHEGLVAEGPMGERPALVWETVGIDGQARCPECGSRLRWSVAPTDQSSDHYVCAQDWRHDVLSLTAKKWASAPLSRCDKTGRKALVLHAPGGPRLGMVRAMEVLDLAYVVTGKTREGSRVVVIGWRNGGAEEVNEVPEKWPDGMPKAADEAFAAAHLALQRGLASEVLVLPVTL